MKALSSSSVVEVAVVADGPLCESCGAFAEFVCPVCELRKLLGQMLENVYHIATCPVERVRRRYVAKWKQMLSDGLEARVRNEGSPTLLAMLSEIQLCLEA